MRGILILLACAAAFAMSELVPHNYEHAGEHHDEEEADSDNGFVRYPEITVEANTKADNAEAIKYGLLDPITEETESQQSRVLEVESVKTIGGILSREMLNLSL
jgi:hypothetical protein